MKDVRDISDRRADREHKATVRPLEIQTLRQGLETGKRESEQLGEKRRIEIEGARRTMREEGGKEALEKLVAGDVTGAENAWNSSGRSRIQPGSLKFDTANGVIAFTDGTGKQNAIDVRHFAAVTGVVLAKDKAGGYRIVGDYEQGQAEVAGKRKHAVALERVKGEEARKTQEVKNQGKTISGMPKALREQLGKDNKTAAKAINEHYGKQFAGGFISFDEKEKQVRWAKVIAEHLVFQGNGKALPHDAYARAVQIADDVKAKGGEINYHPGLGQWLLWSGEKDENGEPAAGSITTLFVDAPPGTSGMSRDQDVSATGTGGPPQSAIDALKTAPDRRTEFDRKYGAGAADKVIGGGGGEVSPPAAGVQRSLPSSADQPPAPKSSGISIISSAEASQAPTGEDPLAGLSPPLRPKSSKIRPSGVAEPRKAGRRYTKRAVEQRGKVKAASKKRVDDAVKWVRSHLSKGRRPPKRPELFELALRSTGLTEKERAQIKALMK
jgi:hypothetical protein